MLIDEKNIMNLGFRFMLSRKAKNPSRVTGERKNLLWFVLTIGEGTTTRLHYTIIQCTSMLLLWLPSRNRLFDMFFL
jgi:hypothetical protein